MDCGIPFCHNGCPLGNLIPEWNDLVYRARLGGRGGPAARDQQLPGVHRRLCPAPCESACVLGINAEPVTIKQVEVEIIDRAWASGDVVPLPPGAVRAFGRRGRIRARRAGRGAAADPGRARGDRLRARRRARRPAALRHPRVQDGKAPPGPAARADGGRGHRVSQCGVGSRARRPQLARVRRGGAGAAARGCPATCRCPAATWRASTRRWSTCRPPNRLGRVRRRSPPRASTW